MLGAIVHILVAMVFQEVPTSDLGDITYNPYISCGFPKYLLTNPRRL